MANEGDLGNEAAELFLQAALDAAKATGNERLHYCGRCWNCDAPLEKERFCDKDCLFDFELRQSKGQNIPWR